MRIALVTDVKDDGLARGIERHVFELAMAQKARGDSPTVIVPAAGGLTAACEEHGIPVAIEVRGAERQTIDNLCSLFSNLDAEVIHFHTPNPPVIAAANRIGIPCVYTHHVQKRFMIPELEFAVIAAGRIAFEQLKKEGFPEDRLFYIPNGSKVMHRGRRPRRAAACEGTGGSLSPSLISAGRLEQVKGLDVAILAMAELKRRHGLDCPVLNLYGAGSLEGYLKEMVSLLGLEDRVRFLGVQLDILQRCPATDILVVSSRMETGPLTALEAMSRGMPIVATRVGEIEAMIPDPRYGHVVEIGSITALADGIDAMLSDIRAGRFDPDLSISRHRELYSVEKMTQRVDAVYKSLISRNAVSIS